MNGTIGLSNPNQRSVPQTSGFLHPYICRYTARAFLQERFLAFEREGIAWTGQPSRHGVALFSVRIEFWQSTGMIPMKFLRSTGEAGIDKLS